MSIGILAARGRRWRVVALLLAAVSPLAASADALQPGHAGHWVAPERDGEGWVLERSTPTPPCCTGSPTTRPATSAG